MTNGEAFGTGASSATTGGEVVAELVQELQEGWAPLPTKTLFALVLGGLRVRMTRSLVTMVSIVLAIAFLTYTGFSNKLYFGLAEEVRRRGELTPMDTRRVVSAASVVLGLDLFGDLTPEARREAAVELGMDKVERQLQELGRLAGPLSKARGDLEQARKRLAGLEADPEAIEADLEAARTALSDARTLLGSVEERRLQLSQDIDLGRWLASGGEEGSPEITDRLLGALAERQQHLLGRAARFGQLGEEEMGQVEVMLDVAAGKVPGEAARRVEIRSAVATLRKALDEAGIERAATRLRIDLRRAGISVESQLKGTDLSTWLIIMALLTCAVGIANAVLMSVTERFREIGTMKCLGAQDGLVVKMFVLESIMLGATGALMGMVLGIAVALAAGLAQFGWFGLRCFPLARGLPVVGWSLVAGMFLAVVGAVYPALVAARMQPVDALRADE